MAQWFVGEFRYFSFNTIPQGWLICDGALYLVKDYPGLAHFIGKTYGGDGTTNFRVPDMRGRVIMGVDYAVGHTGGLNSVPLKYWEMPAHNHTVAASTATGTSGNPQGNTFAECAPPRNAPSAAPPAPALYTPKGANPVVSLYHDTIDVVGAGAGHENRQPYRALVCCIASNGIPPTRG